MDACLQFRIFSMAGLTPFAQIGTPYVISLSCFRPFDLSRFLLPVGAPPARSLRGLGTLLARRVALADQSLPTRLKYWTRVELLIIDEFGFERLARTLSPQAANLMYKVIDGRSPRRSTSLVTSWNGQASVPCVAAVPNSAATARYGTAPSSSRRGSP